MAARILLSATTRAIAVRGLAGTRTLAAQIQAIADGAALQYLDVAARAGPQVAREAALASLRQAALGERLSPILNAVDATWRQTVGAAQTLAIEGAATDADELDQLLVWQLASGPVDHCDDCIEQEGRILSLRGWLTEHIMPQTRWNLTQPKCCLGTTNCLCVQVPAGSDSTRIDTAEVAAEIQAEFAA